MNEANESKKELLTPVNRTLIARVIFAAA